MAEMILEADQLAECEDVVALANRVAAAGEAVRISEAQADRLRDLMPTLSADRLALALALAEGDRPARFVDLAVEYLTHDAMSVRLAAVRVLGAAAATDTPADRDRIRRQLRNCPEGDDFAEFLGVDEPPAVPLASSEEKVATARDPAVSLTS